MVNWLLHWAETLAGTREMSAAFLQLNLDDAEQVGEISGWDLDLRQLSRGSFNGEQHVLGLEHLQLMQVSFNRKLQQLGAPPEGYLAFGLLDHHCHPFTYCGHEIGAEHVISFNQHDGFQAATHPGHHAYTIALSIEYLKEVSEFTGRGFDPEAEIAPIFTPSARTNTWLTDTENLFARLKRDGIQSSDTNLQNLQFELAYDVISAISTENNTLFPSGKGRRRVITRAIDYIEDNLDRDFSIQDLCIGSHTSWSTLGRAFKDEFGISPKDYILGSRLKHVRAMLRKPGQDTTVRDAATRWGFQHLSQFAKYYRAMFGELPSETLATARQVVAITTHPHSTGQSPAIAESFGRSPAQPES